MNEKSEKKRLPAFLLCLFLGPLGIHRFYAGKAGTGILWLLTGGLLGVGVLVDLISILTGAFKDKEKKPIKDWTAKKEKIGAGPIIGAFAVWLVLIIVVMAIVAGLGTGTDTPIAESTTAQQKAEASGEAAKEPAEPETTPVTLDGYDAEAKITVHEINLWKEYENRAAGVAGTAKHGQQVQMIERKGDGVLVETDSGVKGWVTYYFIKELK